MRPHCATGLVTVVALGAVLTSDRVGGLGWRTRPAASPRETVGTGAVNARDTRDSCLRLVLKAPFRTSPSYWGTSTCVAFDDTVISGAEPSIAVIEGAQLLAAHLAVVRHSRTGLWTPLLPGWGTRRQRNNGMAVAGGSLGTGLPQKTGRDRLRPP